MKRPVVAIYSGDIPSTTFIENLIEGMAEAGFSILLFGKQTKSVEYKGDVKLIPTPEGKLSLIVFVIIQSLRLYSRDRQKFAKMMESIRRHSKPGASMMRKLGVLLPVMNNQPDVFHIQWAKAVHLHPELAELLEGKTALSLRGAHINYSPLNDPPLAESYRKTFPNISAFHAVSEAIAKEAESYGASKSKTSVIYSSVRDEMVTGHVPVRSFGKKIQMISVGRFHWKKGYHYGLDALKLLKDKGLDIHYTIVAQGDVPEEIAFLIHELGLNREVTIVPGMRHPDLIRKMKDSDLLLLPSVEEGIANVVLEAMASGVPVVTTDCGGMNEALTDGREGFVSPVREPEIIAEKILKLVKLSPDEAGELKSNALERINRQFSRKRQIEQFGGFYQSVAGG